MKLRTQSESAVTQGALIYTAYIQLEPIFICVTINTKCNRKQFHMNVAKTLRPILFDIYLKRRVF